VTPSIAESQYRVTVLEPDRRRAAELDIALDSRLGAVVAHTGRLVMDGGRLRVFGSVRVGACGARGDRRVCRRGLRA
jgi:hypothetical protein